MKIHAYFLAATPLWSKASITAYYAIVEKIYVTYDGDGLGWAGKPVDVQETLNLLREIDTEGKMEFCAGSYHDTSFSALENEMKQRQDMLKRAAENKADWVLQLDADEVMASPETFFKCLKLADEGGYDAMEYPAHFLYQYIDGNRFLVQSRRFLQVAAGFPGPMALKPSCTFKVARQCDGRLFRVDFAAKNTDPFHGDDALIHHVISPSEGIIHFAWVRSKKLLKEKFANHASISEASNNTQYRNYLIWDWCGKHPYLAVLRSPFIRRRDGKRHLRLATFPSPNSYVSEELKFLSGEDK